MNSCRLDNLPVELIHHLLSYFSPHEIFYSFINVTSYINAVLAAYLNYTVNFKSITKTNFDLTCQHIIPDQVISLTLSDDEETPGLIELFLSRFQINQFTRLHSLRLFDIGPDFWEIIIAKLVELKNLRSFSYFPSDRSDSWVCKLSADDVTLLDKYLADRYAPVLAQLYRLRLGHGNFLTSIQFPCLRHLVLQQSSVDIIKHICSVAPELKSLDTSFSDDTLTTELIFPLPQLNRLVLRLPGVIVSMNDIERMISNFPRLKHLELVGNFNKDAVDGQRWEMKVKCLVTFKFMFNLSVELESRDLDSFRTSFWLEEKCWFVAYTYKRLFSVPDFAAAEADEHFNLPLFSTVSDNTIFYERIDKLQVTETPDNVGHHFTHVQTLTLGSSVPLSTLGKTVNLSRVQHLIFCSSVKSFLIKVLINEMPNLYRLSIEYDIRNFLKQIRCEKIDKIQWLEITSPFRRVADYNIEQLCTVFPNIKHLHVDHICAAIKILDFLNGFKHLSTISFCYTSWSASEEEMQQCRLKVQSVLDRLQRRRRLNYTHRFDSRSVHIWIS